MKKVAMILTLALLLSAVPLMAQTDEAPPAVPAPADNVLVDDNPDTVSEPVGGSDDEPGGQADDSATVN